MWVCTQVRLCLCAVFSLSMLLFPLRVWPNALEVRLIRKCLCWKSLNNFVTKQLNLCFRSKVITIQLVFIYSWRGKHFWGVSHGAVNLCSESRPAASSGGLSVVLSSSEKQVVKETLTSLCGPDRLMYASGAGYKILCVIQGLADVYILSEGSTFKWDSCAPHALLRALGGGVVDLKKCLQSSVGAQDQQTELTYHQANAECKGADRWANYGGLVAYRDCSQLCSVTEALRGKL